MRKDRIHENLFSYPGSVTLNLLETLPNINELGLLLNSIGSLYQRETLFFIFILLYRSIRSRYLNFIPLFLSFILSFFLPSFFSFFLSSLPLSLTPSLSHSLSHSPPRTSYFEQVDWEEYNPPLYRQQWGRVLRSPIKATGKLS